MNTTLKEAKQRYASHTKSVLSDTARAAAKSKKEWEVKDGVPTLILGNGQFYIEFFKSEFGHTFARCNGAK